MRNYRHAAGLALEGLKVTDLIHQRLCPPHVQGWRTCQDPSCGWEPGRRADSGQPVGGAGNGHERAPAAPDKGPAPSCTFLVTAVTIIKKIIQARPVPGHCGTESQLRLLASETLAKC